MPGFSILGFTVQPAMISLFILAFVLGMCVPFRYGIERLRGFGRFGLAKIPYKPPEEGGGNSSSGPVRDENGQFKKE